MRYQQRAIRAILAIVAAAAGAFALSTPVQAQGRSSKPKPPTVTSPSARPTPVIAVVDFNSVIAASKAMRGVRQEAQKVRKRFQKEFDDERKAIQVAVRKLEKQRPNMLGKDFDAKRRQIEIRALNLRRQTQQRTIILRRSFAQTTLKFRQATITVVKELAVEKGYNLVVAKAVVLHAAPQFDVTKEVTARINKRLPKIKFELLLPKTPSRGTQPGKKRSSRTNKPK